MIASTEVLQTLAKRHESGTLRDAMGRTISEIPTQGLVDESIEWFYPCSNGIPNLLADEAIAVPPTL